MDARSVDEIDEPSEARRGGSGEAAPSRMLDSIDLGAAVEGQLLPPRAYTSAAVFDAELRHIFERSWLHVADVSELRRAGDYVTASAGRVPLVIVRGEDGALRGFVNACRHRGATVAEGAGNCGATLRCPYHGWSYDTAGRLRGVPFREEFACLDQRDLLTVRIAQAGPLVFACTDENAPSFEEWAGSLLPALQRARAAEMEPAFELRYEVGVNWKISVENALDGYHVRFVHDTLADLLATEGAENGCEAHSSFTRVPISPEYRAQLPPELTAEPVIRFGLIFPNIIPVLTPFDLSYLRIDPVAPDRIVIRSRSFDLDGFGRVTREFRQEAAERTNRQDIAVVERVQRGLQAPSLPAGIHSTRLEARIGHFQRLWREMLRKMPPLRMAG
jgi:choline monooxygenase